jgi:serine/threonine protein kinase
MAEREEQRLGTYRLLERLGRGGFGEVYLGEHIHLGTKVAIKLLAKRVVGNDEVATFQQEARILANLKHPNIVRVLDFDVEDSTNKPYLVMDYAPNGTLRERSPRNTLPSPLTVVAYVKQIAAALQYAHEKGVMHLDVKPASILLGRNDELLLSDFGSARLSQTESTSEYSAYHAAGTPDYMAPEQIEGKPCPASDQYALAIMVYEWFCGQPPFLANTENNILYQHIHDPVQPLRKQYSMSPAIEQVVLKALAKKPEERFDSVDAFATALEREVVTSKGISRRNEVSRQVGEKIGGATRKFLSRKEEVDIQAISQAKAIQEVQSSPTVIEQKETHVGNLAIHGSIQGLVYGENNTVTINIQGSERTIPFLAPPQPTQVLVGRENLLHDLKQKLFKGGNLALSALNGLPGVGKTALALALAHDQEVLAHFSDGILWAGLGREANVISFLKAWGIAMDISQAEIEKLMNPTSLAQTVHRAIGARRMLLIIDDAWSTEDALAFKLGGPHCAHMVTTRLPEVAERFASEGTITIRELSEQDSLTLLEKQAPGVSIKAPEGVREIIQAVDGLPLPLILMGNYLRIQMKTGQPRRLQAALDRLLQVKERLQLEQPQGGLERHPSLPEGIPLSQLAVIQISDEALGKEAQQTLRALSVFPPKPNSFSEAAALAVAATNNQAIDTLLDFGLLESSGPERYTLHQTISDYAQLNLIDTTVYEQMVKFFIDYVQAHKTDRNLLERETSNILAAVEIMLEKGMNPSGASVFAYFIRIVRRTRVI